MEYELKSFLKTDEENRHVFNQELEALRRVQHQAGVVKLMDVLEDEISISLVLLPKGQFTLGSLMDQQTDSCIGKVSFARDTVFKLA